MGKQVWQDARLLNQPQHLLPSQNAPQWCSTITDKAWSGPPKDRGKSSIAVSAKSDRWFWSVVRRARNIIAMLPSTATSKGSGGCSCFFICSCSGYNCSSSCQNGRCCREHRVGSDRRGGQPAVVRILGTKRRRRRAESVGKIQSACAQYFKRRRRLGKLGLSLGNGSWSAVVVVVVVAGKYRLCAGKCDWVVGKGGRWVFGI